MKNDHCGHLVLYRVWLERWDENTFYGNNVQGKTTIKNSFFPEHERQPARRRRHRHRKLRVRQGR
ncbi:hypothetical protein [Haladaptatus halobius]|uniref:hypothetical protein n=1 Tax=Haladaptatus halobius TaxID=2884875 RepID=UPI001D0B6037|nr:hypothetical protein [Haladaptatus halobius]